MEPMTPSTINARTYHDQGMNQLNHLVLAEERAKLGVLTATLAGVNVVLVGDPGGGKTTLGVDAYRLIEGITPADVAEIPSLADLTPKQVAGGTAESVTVTTDEDGKKTEVANRADVKGVIVPTTKWIFANEINRTAPHAVNALLEAIENKTITTQDGTHRLDDMQVAVATMNPGEATQGVFRMTRALASRFAIGVVMGDERGLATGGRSDQLIELVYNGWEPNADAVRTVANIDDLKQMRSNLGNIQVAESLVRSHVIPAVHGIADVLRDEGYGEGLPRIAKQLGRISRALAAMRSENEVTPREIADAADFMVTGRLGILHSDVVNRSPQLVEDVHTRAHLRAA